MAWGRAAIGIVAAVVVAGALVSGGSRADSVRQDYLPASNELRTVVAYGRARIVDVRSLGEAGVVRPDPGWLARARPLDSGAPPWARRMYRRSLLVLRGLTDRRTGAVLAGARAGWDYVWPRDASAVAMALASAGYRREARRIVRFLLRLNLGAAARFHPDGAPVAGRDPQGDAVGWVAVAAEAARMQPGIAPHGWHNRSDYQEGGPGDYLGNALSSSAVGTRANPAPDIETRRLEAKEIRADFEAGGVLVRQAATPGSGLDSAAAWAVRPFRLGALYPFARRTLLRLARTSGSFGILPSEDWNGGMDPWTAPTAWTAWSLAALGERHAALRLMAELRRAATRDGMLPERVNARTGVPTSTTPLAWSHAFAILALRQLWPRTRRGP